ncbi:MAG: zf-HC2 domain-containing protein [Acidobacteriota bacterium]
MNNKNLDCKKIEELLSGFIENDLSPDERRNVEQHLASCSKCSEKEENILHLRSVLPELTTDIPFFMKNRLYYIAEAEEHEPDKQWPYIKWVAAAIGTIILFLNLFYFTNIFPAANKTLHTAVAGIEKFVVETEAFFERIKESNNNLRINKNESISKNDEEETEKETTKMTKKGVIYG